MSELCPSCGRPLEPSTATRLDAAEYAALGLDHASLAWAEHAIASSHWGSGSTHGPSRAAGPPEIFPRSGDQVGAWAPALQRAGYQWITLDFPDVPPADAIFVFETFGPGAVVCVHEGHAMTEAPPKQDVIWRGPPRPASTAPQVLRVPVSPPRSIHHLTLWLDTDAVKGYNEIDAVGLRTVEPPGPPRGGRAGRATRLSPSAMKERGWIHDRHLDWAKSARASSEWGQGSSWGAGRATGPPAVYPDRGDRPGTWSPAGKTSGEQWLWLDFGTHRMTEAIYVFETCGAGAVFCIEEPGDAVVGYRQAIDDRVLWRDEPQLEHADRATVLVVEIDPPRPLRHLRIWIDTDAVPGYNQIDAVALRSVEPVHGEPVAWDQWRPRKNWSLPTLVLLLAILGILALLAGAALL